MGRIADNMSAPETRTIDGLEIRYVRNSATRPGPHILLLSPWPESLFAFAPTWDAFAAIGRVVAVDLPGIGRSQGRPELMSPEPMGNFLKLIVEAFDLDRPHVVGPDVGTSAALYAESNHPGIFESVIIGSGAVDHRLVGDGLNILVNGASTDAFKDLTGPGFVEAAAKNLANYKVPEKIRQDFLASYEGSRFLESVAFLRAYPSSLPVLADRLPDIAVPSLIIAGRNDPFVLLPNAELLHARLPNSRLAILETGHFTWEDGADDYARISVEWIRGGYQEV